MANGKSKQTEPSQSSALEKDLASRIELERLVAEISISFHVSNEIDLDKAIDSALAAIGNFVGADRSSLFRYDYRAGTASNTQEWCAEGIEAQMHLMQDLPIASFAWTVEMLEKHELIDIPRVSDLPGEAVNEKQIFEEQGIQSILQVNVMGREGKPMGILSFDAVRSVRPWRDEDHYLLNVFSRILAAAFEQIRMVDALKRSEATTQAILNSLPDLMFILDREGVITGHHAKNKGELAIAVNEIVGSSSWDILSPDVHDLLRKAMDQAHRLGTAEPFEYSLELQGGNTHYYEGRLAKLDEEHVLALIRDITDRKRNENSLKWFSSQLSIVEENQRRHLASQLHDGVSQDLAAAAIKLQQSFSSADKEASDKLIEISALIQDALLHAQELTKDLSPPVLYELGISPALSSLATTLFKQSGIPIHLDTPAETLNLEPSFSIHLYRIARELLVNAIKHSEADKIRMALESDLDFIRLTVMDNGKGFDPDLIQMRSDLSKAGFGLFSIRQRLEPLGGTMTLRNNGGAEIRVRIPRLADSRKESREP